jgi:RNA polymerase sigma-70 factor (ECF subfamily)
MTKHISDEQLAKLSFSDKKYFNPIVKRYVKKIRRYLARLIGNWQESEDITQEVFIKTYTNIGSFNSKMKFSSWIYRIAHNEGVNFIKKHYKIQKVRYDDQINHYFYEQNNALSKILQNENKEKIKEGLFKLPKKDSEILELYYFDDKSYLEIADILEISINSVGSKIKRAKDKLKKTIDDKK